MSAWSHLYAVITFNEPPEELPEFNFPEDFTGSRETFVWSLPSNEQDKRRWLGCDVRYVNEPDIFMPWLFYLVEHFECSIEAEIMTEYGMYYIHTYQIKLEKHYA